VFIFITYFMDKERVLKAVCIFGECLIFIDTILRKNLF
jgi:hypothetical protein